MLKKLILTCCLVIAISTSSVAQFDAIVKKGMQAATQLALTLSKVYLTSKTAYSVSQLTKQYNAFVQELNDLRVRVGRSNLSAQDKADFINVYTNLMQLGTDLLTDFSGFISQLPAMSAAMSADLNTSPRDYTALMSDIQNFTDKASGNISKYRAQIRKYNVALANIHYGSKVGANLRDFSPFSTH